MGWNQCLKSSTNTTCIAHFVTDVEVLETKQIVYYWFQLISIDIIIIFNTLGGSFIKYVDTRAQCKKFILMFLQSCLFKHLIKIERLQYFLYIMKKRGKEAGSIQTRIFFNTHQLEFSNKLQANYSSSARYLSRTKLLTSQNQTEAAR